MDDQLSNNYFLKWIDETIPCSTRFFDTYYSEYDGHHESNYVFIQGNNLPGRWLNMDNCIIAELGFGTGLNFLETWQLWQKTSTSGARLTFISFEQYPLKPEEMARALSRWPLLNEYSKYLIRAWSNKKNIIKSDNCRLFTWQVTPLFQLKVYLGDANILLPGTNFAADAWYLDGFAPSRNPEMWNKSLLTEVYNHTAYGGTFSTYTAAGHVRRKLSETGFLVTKNPGFAKKREMLKGIKKNGQSTRQVSGQLDKF